MHSHPPLSLHSSLTMWGSMFYLCTLYIHSASSLYALALCFCKLNLYIVLTSESGDVVPVSVA